MQLSNHAVFLKAGPKKEGRCQLESVLLCRLSKCSTIRMFGEKRYRLEC